MISVVIPVYNSAKFLAATIQSLQAQTYSDWELMIVDDGSKDQSLAVAEEFQRNDRRISVFPQPNAGVSATRNLGLAKSSAAFPYVLWLDNDDLLAPGALQTLLSLLEAHPDASGACGFVQDVDASGAPLLGHDRLEPLTGRRGIEGSRLVRRTPDAALVFGDLCFHNHLISPGQVLVRKSALQTAGAYDETRAYTEDHDLWWRLTMQVGPIRVTPEIVLLYRHHGANASGNKAGRRRGGADFRWSLLTHPAMMPAQKKTAWIGYFYHCLVGLEFGLHYLRKGEIKHGLKHAGLGLRDLLLYARDLVRVRRRQRLARAKEF